MSFGIIGYGTTGRKRTQVIESLTGAKQQLHIVRLLKDRAAALEYYTAYKDQLNRYPPPFNTRQ